MLNFFCQSSSLSCVIIFRHLASPEEGRPGRSIIASTPFARKSLPSLLSNSGSESSELAGVVSAEARKTMDQPRRRARSGKTLALFDGRRVRSLTSGAGNCRLLPLLFSLSQAQLSLLPSSLLLLLLLVCQILQCASLDFGSSDDTHILVSLDDQVVSE